MDHAVHMEKTQGETTIEIQKVLVSFFVLSGIIGSNMEQSRLIMNCALQVIRGKLWCEKPKFILVAILCATQFTVNIIIFESVYHLLSISTNIVEILKNSLTALLLNQIDNHGSLFIFNFLKSKGRNLVQQPNWMSYKSDTWVEQVLIPLNVMIIAYIVGNIIFLGAIEYKEVPTFTDFQVQTYSLALIIMIIFVVTAFIMYFGRQYWCKND